MTIGDGIPDSTLKHVALIGLFLSVLTFLPTFPGHCLATHNYAAGGWGGIIQCNECANDPELQTQYPSEEVALGVDATTLLPNTTIAFVGDTGSEEDRWGVVAQMIADYGVDGVVHHGDLSYPIYSENPANFISVLNAHLPNTPFVAAIGNHDT